MKSPSLLFLAAVPMLAGCDRAPDTPAKEAGVTNALPPAETRTASTEAAPEPEPPEKADPARATPTPEPPSPKESASGPIPQSLRGRWGVARADCTAKLGEGLLVVGGTTLRFYESEGTLVGVTEREERRIAADFAFTGEGQTWRRRMVLDVQDDGRTLIRREQGDNAMAGALKYIRCAQ